MKIYNFLKLLLFLSLVIITIIRCTKDKVPTNTNHPEFTKWEKIIGEYMVYDTLGNFLFNFKLNYSSDTEYVNDKMFIYDAIFFENFNNHFSFKQKQSSQNVFYPIPIGSYFINIGYQDSIRDKNNNKWTIILSGGYSKNIWINDTLYLCFQQTNIKFWMNDAIPYLDTVIKQVAVKQH